MYYQVWVASQRFHGQESLTYGAREKLIVGQLVRVPLQRSQSLGIVRSETAKPTFATKSISGVLPWHIPAESLQLLAWLSHYYPAPLGMITELFTPPGQLPKKLPELKRVADAHRQTKLPPLTAEQTRALQQIRAAHGSVLLHGETGTGKTRVYLELAQEAVAHHKSALILTPEIGLTKPLLKTFQQTFGTRVIVTHSNMTPKERREAWIRIATSTRPVVVIGPRSALFSPLRNVGLIVMDEAHDSAFKQEQAPYYQTSRVAAQLAQLHGALFVMGTATPLTTDYFTFVQKGLPIVRMTTPALPTPTEVRQTIIDQRGHEHFNRSPWLADAVISGIETALENDEQSLLFLNRRGSARLVMCQTCGWQALCPNCDVPLVYHGDQHLMRCHSCDYHGSVPSQCPVCGAMELIFKSIGTKALVAEAMRLFPKARVARFDRDNTKAEQMSQIFGEVESGKIDILVGTQSLVKGFDLPKLAVVAIVQADSGLQIPDYTATERSYQLISQVSGRIGRGHRAGQLFLQTYQPENPLFALALGHDYEQFYETEIKEREQFKFPPYHFLLKVSCERASSASARSACQKLADQLRTAGSPVIVEGPTPRFIEKLAGKYAWHLIVKARNRGHLLDVIKALPSGFYYDLDPSDLL